jgi:hypothetical protein
MSQATIDKPNIPDLKRLRDIAAHLDSEHDGEVLNAARLLVRAAAAAGLKVQEIIALPVAATPQPRPQNPQDFWAQRAHTNAAAAQAYAWQQGSPEGKSARRWRDVLVDVMSKATGTKLLNETEEKLVFYTFSMHMFGTTKVPTSDILDLFTIARRLGIPLT